ncbi:MAG: SusC/RagA family protein [Flavobacteriaceae bacterium]|nr:MAG: SusC/RagA family protein [Flavobacteriaceae bacterium]
MKTIKNILLLLAICCLSMANSYAQQAKTIVKGVILDEMGLPLPGASVILEGTTVGTTSDFDGVYQISFQPTEKNILIFQFISFKEQRIKITKPGEQELNVHLKNDNTQLNEVVIIGFGVKKKINLTGAVSQIGSEVLEARPITQAAQALQGVIPGLNIGTDSGGELDGALNINIRGAGTIGEGSNGSPLILIDGIEGSLNSVNPNDIANISVLKDAAAASIYGSRAPFGVILVTTKKGSKGKTVINYSSNFRFSTPINIPDRMNSLQFAYFVNDLMVNSGRNENFKPNQIQKIIDYRNGDLAFGTEPNSSNTNWLSNRASYGNTDWYNVHLKKLNYGKEHNISLKGGGEKINYYVSSGFLEQGGAFVYAKEKFKRNSISAKFNIQLNDKVALNINTRFIRKKHDKPTGQDERFYHNLSRAAPTTPVFSPYGDYMSDSMIQQLKEGGRTVASKDYLYNKIDFVYEPYKDWKIYGAFNSRIENHNNTKHIAKISVIQPRGNSEYISVFSGYIPKIEVTPWGLTSITSPGQNYYQTGQSQVNYSALNLYTDYLKTFNEHSFKLLVGVQNESYEVHRTQIATDNIDSDDKPFITQNGEKYVFESKGAWNNIGVFSRLNYNYKQRYLLEINGRVDGASRFPKEQRWGFFPSASAGWNVSKESFWEPISSIVGRFKIRGSWGVLGNQNTSSFYPYFQKMNINNGKWAVDGSVPSQLAMPAPFSATITWEKIESHNIGFDAGFFSNRLTSSFDIYQRKTSEMIGPAPVKPAAFGATVPKTNNAELQTNGWELELSWRDQLNDNFSYHSSLVVSDGTSKITQYSNPEKLLFVDGKDQFYKGKKMGEIWGYQSSGIAKTDLEMINWLKTNHPSFGASWAGGDMMYRDLNNDNVIDSGAQKLNDSGDMRVIGNSTPRYFFGVNLGCKYKVFDFSVFIQGVAKRDVLLSGGAFYPGIHQWQISPYKDHLDYFRPFGSALGENIDAYYPRPYIGDKNYKAQSHFLQDASYARLKNVQVGFSLPKKFAEKIGVTHMRIYLSGENIYTITNLKMFDPEGIKDLINGSGKTYPMSATYSTGLTITF